MSELHRGVYYTTTNNKGKSIRRFAAVAADGSRGEPISFAGDQLDKRLPYSKEAEIQVEYEMEDGRPVRIRPAGKEWQKFEAAPPATKKSKKKTRANSSANADFHNPYNFIPAPDREGVTGEQSDNPPIGHFRYHNERWTGKISVQMTLKTPMLLPDVFAYTERDKHRTFPVRTKKDNKTPDLLLTSIKGMLRSAYEAVTNSRLGVFEKHHERLAYRMNPKEGLDLVPAVVEKTVSGHQVVLLPGKSRIGKVGIHNSDPMFAAWVPYYKIEHDRFSIAPWAVKYPIGKTPAHRMNLPQHGDRVQVLLELMEKGHYFQYWRVREIVAPGHMVNPSALPSPARGQHRPVAGTHMIVADGYVCWGNHNIDRKHDERVFFADPSSAAIGISQTRQEWQELCSAWKDLINNYQKCNKREIDNGASGPPASAHSVWSRHITGGAEEQKLQKGTLCYAEVRKQGSSYKIEALYPVNISRKLHQLPPRELVPKSLLSATDLGQLSPADRVFGWVKQNGSGAYKGNVRLSNLQLASAPEEAIEDFGGEGLALNNLGEPKPQQARFYVAKDKDGTPQDQGGKKEERGYNIKNKGIRGRKTYPHHRDLPDGYWQTDPSQDEACIAVGDRYREYRRVKNERDTQNRSTKGWVKENTTFTFDIHITNLSDVELGALLWLLSLNEDEGKDASRHMRLGGGKPLGFGSVTLTITASELANLDALKQRYLLSPQTDAQHLRTKEQRQPYINAFQTEVVNAYGKGGTFAMTSFIAAFLRAAEGFDDNLPVHYPRTGDQPETELYQWFSHNDKNGGQTLGNLANDPGLPYPTQ